MTRQDKFRLLIKWTFQHTWALPVSYIASLVVILLFCAIFGISMNEFGTWWQQLVMQVAGGAVLGAGVGLLQRSFMKKVFTVPASWTGSLIFGFIIAEAITGLICWRLGINRMELRFIELNALPESLIFAFAGFLTGLFQWFILKKHFTGSVYWIPASLFAWGICIVVMDYPKIFNLSENSSASLLIDILVFMLGATLYGALTGVVLMRILRKKDIA